MGKTIEEKLRIGGGVAFWRLASQTSQPRLADSMADIGHATLAPEKRRLVACLRDALDDTVGGKNFLIRSLPKKDGFAVIEEEADVEARRLRHKQILTAYLVGDEAKPFLHIEPSWTSSADKILTAYAEQQEILRPAQVGGMLTKAALLLGGTTLREMGGIYWIPDAKLTEWQKITAAAESCSVSGKTCCYMLRHIMDADAVRAVRDAVVMEVTAESERLHKEIMSQTLGERALKARKDQADDLLAKLADYEFMLSTGLEEIKQRVEQVEEAAAAAVILAAGQEGAA